MRENIYEQFKNLFPYIQIVCDNEVSMAVTDTEQYLYVDLCEELDLKLKNGDKIPEGGAVNYVKKKIIIRNLMKILS